MIKLKQILLKILNEADQKQEKNYAPYGIMFFGNDKVLVGDNHETPIELSQDLIDRIVAIGKKHGYYGEGSGIKDNPAVNKSEVFRALKDSSVDKGSWDSLIPSPKNKSDFLYAMFANTKENDTIKRLTDKVEEGDTILSLLQRERHNYSATGGTTVKDVEAFLRDASDAQHNFLEMAKKPATKESLKNFIETGESKTFPEGKSENGPNRKKWEDFEHNAGKVAQRALQVRDNWIIDPKRKGVYFIGNGHLISISTMTGSFTQFIKPKTW